jgi:tetratricopeptide (TPR) repeat protein
MQSLKTAAGVVLLMWGAHVGFPGTVLAVDNEIIDQLYGSGVHAYFQGDFRAAYEHLTAAIQAETRDPRAFYFRGLALLRLGRPEQAEKDFAQGAALEADETGKMFDVGRALRRVQGAGRLLVEQYRHQARVQAEVRRRQEEIRRFGRIQENEPRILISPQLGPGGGPVTVDPFSEDDLRVKPQTPPVTPPNPGPPPPNPAPPSPE